MSDLCLLVLRFAADRRYILSSQWLGFLLPTGPVDWSYSLKDPCFRAIPSVVKSEGQHTCMCKYQAPWLYCVISAICILYLFPSLHSENALLFCFQSFISFGVRVSTMAGKLRISVLGHTSLPWVLCFLSYSRQNWPLLEGTSTPYGHWKVWRARLVKGVITGESGSFCPHHCVAGSRGPPFASHLSYGNITHLRFLCSLPPLCCPNPWIPLSL